MVQMLNTGFEHSNTVKCRIQLQNPPPIKAYVLYPRGYWIQVKAYDKWTTYISSFHYVYLANQ